MTDEPEDIDTLMVIDAMDLSKQDLAKIIAYQRKMRALREQGVKPKRQKDTSTPAVSLKELLATVPKPVKPAPAPKPTGGFRRF